MKDIEEKTDTCRLGRGGGMDKDLTGHARQSCGCKRPSRICPIAWIVATRRARRDLQAAPGCGSPACWKRALPRSEEHKAELQSLMRKPYAVCCLKKKTTQHSTS